MSRPLGRAARFGLAGVQLDLGHRDGHRTAGRHVERNLDARQVPAVSAETGQGNAGFAPLPDGGRAQQAGQVHRSAAQFERHRGGRRDVNTIAEAQGDGAVGLARQINGRAPDLDAGRPGSRKGELLTALLGQVCLLYTSPSPRDRQKSRMPSSA